ncbi:nicotinamide riboside transporter PnuC [Anatilimnocola sp. NA78]|uniref:nicotinamide riboside transporter PnuC n=1 Tax=Anatilimnocola sp. NA78 TaxID=3415683 RepID=UPI003CE54F69
MTSEASSLHPRIRWPEWAVMVLAAIGLLVLALVGWLRYDEVFGFITGGICVWLVVRQHVWNWPIGLANNAVFLVLFWQSRLYADMGLQVVYFGLGLYGWWNWLRRGPDSEPLQPTNMRAWEWVGTLVFIAAGTLLMQQILLWASGAAPFWDALTTAISLAAQYLLCRKRIENWYFWIIADIIYVPLYLSRNLPLTAALYGIFLVMCIVGLFEWRTSLRKTVPRGAVV